MPGPRGPGARNPPGSGPLANVPAGWAAAGGSGCAPTPGRGRRRRARTPAVVADAFGLPGSGAFAPAALGVWSPRRRSRVAGMLEQRGPRRAAVGGWVRRARRAWGETPAGHQRRADRQSAGRVPCPASEIKGTVITWILRATTRIKSQRPPAPGFCPLYGALSPGGLPRAQTAGPPQSFGLSKAGARPKNEHFQVSSCWSPSCWSTLSSLICVPLADLSPTALSFTSASAPSPLQHQVAARMFPLFTCRLSAVFGRVTQSWRGQCWLVHSNIDAPSSPTQQLPVSLWSAFSFFLEPITFNIMYLEYSYLAIDNLLVYYLSAPPPRPPHIQKFPRKWD